MLRAFLLFVAALLVLPLSSAHAQVTKAQQGTASVTTSAQSLPAIVGSSLQKRGCGVTVINDGTTQVNAGGAGVTTSTGIKLCSGSGCDDTMAFFPWQTQALYLIGASATSVRYLVHSTCLAGTVKAGSLYVVLGKGKVCRSSGCTMTGQLVVTHDPASTAAADAAVRLTATGAANELYIAVDPGGSGTPVFSVDKEGDVTAGIFQVLRSGNNVRLINTSVGNPVQIDYLQILQGQNIIWRNDFLANQRYISTVGHDFVAPTGEGLRVVSNSVAAFDVDNNGATFGVPVKFASATYAATDCDEASEAPRIVFHDNGTTITACACEKTGASSWAFGAMTAAGSCP